MKMMRVTDETHSALLEVGRYGDTISDIIKRLVNYYNFNHVLDILNERDRKLIPTQFMKTLREVDARAIDSKKSNEFSPEDGWELLGGFNIEKVYPIVEYFFLHELGYITKHPNGKISITNSGRKYGDQEFTLPAKIKELVL